METVKFLRDLLLISVGAVLLTFEEQEKSCHQYHVSFPNILFGVRSVRVARKFL